MRRWGAIACTVAFAALAAASARADDEDPFADVKSNEPVLMQADTVTYDSNTNVVRAEGHVEFSTSARVLMADAVSYDQSTGRVTATGHVTMLEPDGDVVFADSLDLTQDLKEGVIQNFSVLFQGHIRLAAARAQRRGGTVTVLDRGIFTPCEVCKDDPTRSPVWQIKAVRVTHDETTKRIRYEDATFEAFGIPIAYIPYFEHADPTVERETGFLSPRIGSTTELGYFIETPYYWALAPNYDLTLAPLIATDTNPVLKAEWRHRTTSGHYWLQGSVTYADELNSSGDSTGEQNFYSHLFGLGRFAIDEDWGWGFDVELASNDTYLDRYDISNRDRLTSRGYVQYVHDRSFAFGSIYYFQGLRAIDDEGLTPIALPSIEISWAPEETVLSGRLRANLNFLALHRSDGLDTRRLSSSVEWKLPYIADTGEVFTFFAVARGDIYHTADPDPVLHPGVEDNETVARGLFMAGIDYRWPFVRKIGKETQILEPIGQFIIAPYGGNPDEVPNEDSRSFEFDDTNLFAWNKFPGFDEWESGPRLNLGLRFVHIFENGGTLEFLGGQTFRFVDEHVFSAGSGLDETESDLVARISLTLPEGVLLTHRMRIDKEDFSVRRNEVYLHADTDWGELDVTYVRLAQSAAKTGLLPREEINAIARVPFTDYWSVIGGFRRDLEEGEMIESRFGFAYEDECSALEIAFRREFTRDRDIEPNTSIVLSIRLKVLGEDEGGGLIDDFASVGRRDEDPLF